MRARADEADKVAARAHFEAGTRLYDIHEYGEALGEYKAAYLAKPDPAFLFNIGQCYRRLGNLEQALGFFRDYLKKTPPDDPRRKSVLARSREIESGRTSDSDLSVPAAAMPPPAPAPWLAPAPAPTPAPAPVPAAAEPAPAPERSLAASASSPGTSEVQPAGLDLTAATTPAQESRATPFYGKWWFWTGVAVVAAATVATILIVRGGSKTASATAALGTQPVFQ